MDYRALLARLDAQARSALNAEVLREEGMKRITVIGLLMMMGCASLPQQTSDFTPGFLAQLRSCGATIPIVADLPVINTKWSIAPDYNGFVARLPPERFHDVDTLLRRLYGSPKIWSERNLDGQPQGVYGPTQASVAIQYVRTADHTEIICVKPQRMSEKAQNQPSEATR